MEYPSCYSCNNGTSAADAVVAFFSRIDPLGNDPANWKVQESLGPLKSLDTLVPGFVDEFLNGQEAEDILGRTSSGLLVPLFKTQSGPIAQALLTVFTAKLGMALYYEHTGEPLPLTGAVFTMYFLNAGLSQDVADRFLSILPTHNTLIQGTRRSATGQFDYRFNTDEKTIIGSLAHFHGNIHFFSLAMAEPENYPVEHHPLSALVKPGELISRMPRPPSAILMPKKRSSLRSDFLLLRKGR